MDIYVQSSGREYGYYWLARGKTKSEAGKIYDFPIFKMSSVLINTHNFSVVLYRLQGELLLLVTGLRTQRQDRTNRYISNSLAWIGRDYDDEIIIREIAEMALNNNLKILDKAIVHSPNDTCEFEVDWKVIEQLIQVSRVTCQSLPCPELQGKIARISDARKQDLAETLMKYNLPSRDGALVIVSELELPSKKSLQQARVWRGLSNDDIIPEFWDTTSKNIFQKVASMIYKLLQILKKIFVRD